jgi:hypothetical protein
MATEVTYLGYTCPLCGECVVVLCSSQHPPIEFVTMGRIETKCKCGLGRTILLADIHLMFGWNTL